ncbi:MAG: hypothetical protein JWR50_2192 [Mucilaginibacter sp.]|nr:hypothetical protein [Mucilaginibacter sp.]
MKKAFKLKAVAVFAVAFLISAVACAQMKGKTIASPRDSVSGKVHGAEISINYGSPSVKGRKIYGGLVPYDQIWRAGANEATFFTTSKDIMIEGKKLPKGRYSFFATPGEKEWKIIFNSASDPHMWGINQKGANDDPSKDVLVASAKPKTVAKTERLKYVITATGFSLIWDTVEVPVTIK